MAKNEVLPSYGVNEIARIPVGTEIRGGVMVATGDIRIDGNFFGRIMSQGKIVLGEGAVVDGSICCKNADISGRFSGKMTVSDVIALTHTSDFKGMLNTSRICIETGAGFNGVCKIISEDEFAELSSQFEKDLYDETANE